MWRRCVLRRTVNRGLLILVVPWRRFRVILVRLKRLQISLVKVSLSD